MLETILSQITPVSTRAADECIARFNEVAKPIGSLGGLEGRIAKIAAIGGSADINISRKAVAVFCADNGVTGQGVTLYGNKVTTAIAGLLVSGRACVCAMAKACGADVYAYDIGMLDTVDRITDKKLMRGTNDITKSAAMSRDCAIEAIKTGIDTVKELKNKGYNIIAAGEVGMGNTTTSAAVVSVLLNLPPRDVTGRGAGIDDAMLARKVSVIEQAIKKNNPDSNDPIDVLHKLGGLDIAALTGVFIGGAVNKIPIVTDGFIASAAALIATLLCPLVRNYIICSHESAEPGARYVMETLNLKPIIKADMCVGEGTGAVALFPLLDMALNVYKAAATYWELGVGN